MTGREERIEQRFDAANVALDHGADIAQRLRENHGRREALEVGHSQHKDRKAATFERTHGGVDLRRAGIALDRARGDARQVRDFRRTLATTIVSRHAVRETRQR